MAESASRWVLEVHGRVQGVGFRDYVRDVASRLGLTGYVWNDRKDVNKVGIVVQGPEPLLRSFLADISGNHGLIAVTRVERVSVEEPDRTLLAFTRVSADL